MRFWPRRKAAPLREVDKKVMQEYGETIRRAETLLDIVIREMRAARLNRNGTNG